jgi:hemoglobin
MPAMETPRDVYVPPINPAEIAGPSREIYAAMGRDQIYAMLEAFYVELGKSPIAGMFAKDLVKSSRRSAAFFVQSCGGPAEYSDQFGPPRMRGRHLAFSITKAARDEWLACFERVLDRAVADFSFPPQHLEDFRRFLRDFSLWMVNTGAPLSGPRV